MGGQFDEPGPKRLAGTAGGAAHGARRLCRSPPPPPRRPPRAAPGRPAPVVVGGVARQREAQHGRGRRARRSPAARGWARACALAQAEPAEANTPRASSACSIGSAGRSGSSTLAMCGARGVPPATVGRAPGTPARRSPPPAGRAAGRDAAAASAGRAPARARRGRSRPGRAGSRCPSAGRAPGRPPSHSGARRAPGRSHSAPAPFGPCSLCADSATLSAPSARTDTGTRPAAWTASQCRWGGRRRPRQRRQRPGDLRHRLQRPELVVHQHHRHQRGVGPTAATTSSARTRPSGPGATSVSRKPRSRQRLERAQHRRVLDGAGHQVAPARRTAPPPCTAQRVGLGAAAGEHDLRRLGADQRRHLARAPAPAPAPPPRPGRAPTTGWRTARRRRGSSPPAPRARAASRRRCPGKPSVGTEPLEDTLPLLA